jgi:ABC-2 type transport system permease protein
MFEDVTKNLRFFLLSLKYNWLSFLVYRTQAFVWMVVSTFSTLSGLISISVIYSISGGLPGWSYFQMLALVGMANMVYSIINFMIGPQTFVRALRNGGFDQALTKPYDPIISIFARYGTPYNIGGIISGIGLLAYALSNTAVNALSIVSSILLFGFGAAAVVMFLVMISLVSYVLFRSGNYLQWITAITTSASQYPLAIYGLAGTLLLTVGFPIGLASFYPAEMLFLKINYVYFLAILVLSVVLFIIFYKTSKWLLKFYTSGGG